MAAKIRWRLKKDGVASTSVDESVSIVYSAEHPRCKLLPLTEEQAAAPEAFGAVENFRVRLLPVLGASASPFYS